jgi:spore germination protein GerM
MNMRRVLSIVPVCICLVFFTSCDKLKLPINKNLEQKEPGNTENKNPSGTSEQNPTQNNQSNNTGSNQTSMYTIKDYCPFKENIKYTYEGEGNEYAAYTVYVDYINGDRIQLRKNNGGTELVSVIENKNGELKTVFSKEEAYYRENFMSKPNNKEEVLLKEPLVKGTTWTLADGSKRYISNVDAPITTPAGNFKALEVTTEGKDFNTIDYYGLNTGLIKTVFTSKGMEVTSTLKELKSNTPLIQTVKFYYPSAADDKLYYTQKKLSFNTNDLTKMTFEKMFKEAPNKNVGRLIGPNVKIRSLYLNGNVVYVDFTKELISEMNAGTGYEALILQAITNTLGEYYGVSKVYITVEDKPYESGHILMKKGQAFTVDTKGSVQLK